MTKPEKTADSLAEMAPKAANSGNVSKAKKSKTSIETTSQVLSWLKKNVGTIPDPEDFNPEAPQPTLAWYAFAIYQKLATNRDPDDDSGNGDDASSAEKNRVRTKISGYQAIATVDKTLLEDAAILARPTDPVYADEADTAVGELVKELAALTTLETDLASRISADSLRTRETQIDGTRTTNKAIRDRLLPPTR